MKDNILLHGFFKTEFFDQLEKQNPKKVFILEGRPSLESSRHSCRELLKRKINPTLIADNMGGFLFNKRLIEEVALAYQDMSDRNALCQIGGLILAVLGKRHNVPIYLYPASVRQEQMGQEKDIFYFNKIRVAPQGIKGYVPLIEWIPEKYVTKKVK